jgi:hypothetical protein
MWAFQLHHLFREAQLQVTGLQADNGIGGVFSHFFLPKVQWVVLFQQGLVLGCGG